MASHFALDVMDKSPTTLFHTNQAFAVTQTLWVSMKSEISLEH